MKFTVLNTYDALIRKARKIQQLAKFFNRPDTREHATSNFTGQFSLFFILDFSQSRFLYIDPFYKNLLHLPPSQPSIENFIDRCHPNDLRIVHQRIFPDVLQFFQRKPVNIHADFSISFNFRIRKADGNDMCVMLRSNRILSSESGNSIAITGFMIDISPFKEDSKIILSIKRNSESNKKSASDFLRAVYFPEAHTHSLSNRELEILQQIGQGLCSKEIAKKLYISEFTVNNHRKKMLKKSGCNNTSELLKRMMMDGGI